MPPLSQLTVGPGAIPQRPPNMALGQGLSFGPAQGQNPSSTLMNSPLFAGIKPKQPGGVGTTNTNTLTKPYTAPASSQTASAPVVSSTLPQAPTVPLAAAPLNNTNSYGIDAKTGQPVGPANDPATPNTPPTQYAGIIGNLLNSTRNSPYNNTAGAALTGATGNSQQTYNQGYGAAQPLYGQISDAATELRNLQLAGVTGEKNIALEGGGAQIMGAADTALQAQLGGQEQAYATEIGNLGGVLNTAAGQQTTGIGGLNTAGGTAITGQGTVQSGLNQAAGLTQPQQNFPFVFNPTTGQFSAPGVTGAGGGSASGIPNLTFNPTQDAGTLTTAVMNSQISFSDAMTALSYGGKNPAAQAQLTQGILNAGGNPTMLQAQAAGAASGAGAVAGARGITQAQNIQTSGTASTSSWGGIYNTANTNYANYSQQQSAINGIANQVLSIMSNAGINPSASQFANTKLNQIATQFSDPKYAAFNTAIQSLQARVGAALQAGEIPTAATGNAAAIANGSIAFPALAATLKQIDAEMGTFVSTQQALRDYAKGQMGTGGTSGGNGTNGSGTMFGNFNGG